MRSNISFPSITRHRKLLVCLVSKSHLAININYLIFPDLLSSHKHLANLADARIGLLMVEVTS